MEEIAQASAESSPLWARSETHARQEIQGFVQQLTEETWLPSELLHRRKMGFAMPRFGAMVAPVDLRGRNFLE